MKIKKALIVYKKSMYRRFILDRQSPHHQNLIQKSHLSVRDWKRIHDEHIAAIVSIRAALKSLSIPFRSCSRYRVVQPLNADLIITVGGDGTFLAAAHHVKNQIMIGVNSSPAVSIGHYCITSAKTFKSYLKKLILDKGHLKILQRLQACYGKKTLGPPALNDILLASRNPAATTRYFLQCSGMSAGSYEDHKSSGIWIATPPGSSAAFHSAGGKKLPLEAKQFAFRVRELYRPIGKKYRYNKGLLNSHQVLKITPKMEDAAIFIDGSHEIHPIPRGKTITFRLSSHPLKVLL